MGKEQQTGTGLPPIMGEIGQEIKGALVRPVDVLNTDNGRPGQGLRSEQPIKGITDLLFESIRRFGS